MKISELKVGDDFSFVGGQTARYKMNRSSGIYLVEMSTNEHTVYEVLKKNKKSVLCRIVLSSIEYTFSFDGIGSGYSQEQKGVDCEVVVVKKQNG